MKYYELTFIFDSNDEMNTKALELVEKEFTTNQVEIIKHDDMGVRNLAYPIKKQDKGHYHYYELNCDPSVVNIMSATFRLMQPIMKYLFVVKDK